MIQHLRRAKLIDAEQFIKVKKSLAMPQNLGETVRGGFLLGTNLETYRFFIENAYVNVLEDKGTIVGFAIILPDILLRNSELWQRKNEINWDNFEAEQFDEKPICYVEQLAVLPESKYRFFGVGLAYLTLLQAFESHEAMFSTIVKEPIFNQASIPFLENVGGKCVGEVNEVLPEFGRLLSRVYFVEREEFRQTTEEHRLIRKVKQQIRSGRAVWGVNNGFCPSMWRKDTNFTADTTIR